VSEAEHTARPLRLVDLPSEHVGPLLSGRTGDIIILRHESEQETMLYRVRDVYSPERPNHAMQPTPCQRPPKLSMIRTSQPATTRALASGG
jgi:hypothetical protein